MLVFDVDMLKNIMIKEYHHFEDHVVSTCIATTENS